MEIVLYGGVSLGVFLPAALFVGSRSNAFIPERKPYVLGIAAAVAVISTAFIAMDSWLDPPRNAESWKLVLFPPSMGLLLGTVMLLLGVFHLVVLDSRVGDAQEAFVDLFDPLDLRDEYRKWPGMGMFTPISRLRPKEKAT